MRQMSPRLPTVIDHLPDLRRYALALTRHGQDAEDLVQEALARAYHHRNSYRVSAPLKPWLMAIVHNTFIDWTRSRSARACQERAMGPISEAVAASQDDVVRLSQVRELFLALPDEQREALHLVAVEGLTYAEAAAVLAVPEGTVLSRVSRARQALRDRENGTLQMKLKIVGGSDGS